MQYKEKVYTKGSKNTFSRQLYNSMNEKTEKSKPILLKFMEKDEAISFQLSVNTEDPDLTKVQLKLVQGAEAHA